MPYAFLEEIAVADVAFRATGKTEDEVFSAAAAATVNVMVEDLATIRQQTRILLRLENDALDLLLFDFLNEFIYLKDAKGLLMRARNIRVGNSGNRFILSAELHGEEIHPQRHPLRADVKAVTLHRFSLEQTGDGWEATVVLDI